MGEIDSNRERRRERVCGESESRRDGVKDGEGCKESGGGWKGSEGNRKVG